MVSEVHLFGMTPMIPVSRMSRWRRLRCWRDLLYRYDFDAGITWIFLSNSFCLIRSSRVVSHSCSLCRNSPYGSIYHNQWPIPHQKCDVFSVCGHTLILVTTSIKFDVTPSRHLPFLQVVNSIQLVSNYSFLLTANQSMSNYWFRANPNVGFDSGLNSAILGYIGCTTTPLVSCPTRCRRYWPSYKQFDNSLCDWQFWPMNFCSFPQFCLICFLRIHGMSPISTK